MNLVDAGDRRGGASSIGGPTPSATDDHLESGFQPDRRRPCIGIRPQHLSLAGGPMGRRCTAKLTNAEFMGHEVYLARRSERTKLVSVVGAAEFEALGARRHSATDAPTPRQLHIFDKADGRNVSL